MPDSFNNVEKVNLWYPKLKSGDVIETGVWRGGSALFAAAVLEVYGELGRRKRRVWLADSFKVRHNLQTSAKFRPVSDSSSFVPSRVFHRSGEGRKLSVAIVPF